MNSNNLLSLHIKNFRSIAEMKVSLGCVNVIFGPNGTGKTSFLDTFWFMRDCAVRGVEEASASRSHGIGVLNDAAGDGAMVEITASTARLSYGLTIGFHSGRIDPLLGESLHSVTRSKDLIQRKVGSNIMECLNYGTQSHQPVELREPHKLSLEWFLNYDPRFEEAQEFDQLLRFSHSYASRSFNFYKLRNFGSESSHETWLWDRAENLWSVLRNLQGLRARDTRYDTIINYMRKAHPRFIDLVLEATGPRSVYASFMERGRRDSISASGVSDGHLHTLILLTALFGDLKGKPGVLLFDEPENSLHPHAQAVLADAFREAGEWGKQIIIATHSPVLLSQFEPEQIFESGWSGEGVSLTRLDTRTDLQELLQQFALGSLFMAEAVAPQSETLP